MAPVGGVALSPLALHFGSVDVRDRARDRGVVARDPEAGAEDEQDEGRDQNWLAEGDLDPARVELPPLDRVAERGDHEKDREADQQALAEAREGVVPGRVVPHGRRPAAYR